MSVFLFLWIYMSNILTKCIAPSKTNPRPKNKNKSKIENIMVILNFIRVKDIKKVCKCLCPTLGYLKSCSGGRYNKISSFQSLTPTFNHFFLKLITGLFFCFKLFMGVLHVFYLYQPFSYMRFSRLGR